MTTEEYSGMINCKNCAYTVCAKKSIAKMLVILSCTAYKPKNPNENKTGGAA
jgi:hypothetical protein